MPKSDPRPNEKFRILKIKQSFQNNRPLHPNLKRVAKDDIFFTDKIKNHCKLYPGLLMIETNVFVAHGRQLSQYYFKDRGFILRDEHFSFSDYIKTIFKIRQDNHLCVGILLDNGEFHVIESND